MAARTSLLTHSALLDESDDDDSEDERLMAEPPVFSQESPSASQGVSVSQQEEEESPTVTPPMTKEKSVEEQVQNKVKFLSLSIADKIKSPSDLYWHRQAKKKDPFPVRICDPSECIFVPSLPETWDQEKKALVQYLGEYERENKRGLVPHNQLTPYNNASDAVEWCPDHVKEYVKALKRKSGKNKLSPVQLRVEEIYLEKLLEKVQENEAKRARQLEEEKEESDNEAQSTATLVEQRKPKAKRRIASLDGAEDSRSHKLRAGDVIEYTHPQFVDGREEGYRFSEIRSIRKGEAYPLFLEDRQLLPKDHRIRRIQRLVRGKLVEYNGKIRAIDEHLLQYDKNEINVGEGVTKEAERIEAIIEKNVAKHQATFEEAGIPMDLMQNIGGKKKNKENVTESVDNASNNDDQKMPATVDDNNTSGKKRKAADDDVSLDAVEATKDGSKKRAKRVSESPPKAN